MLTAPRILVVGLILLAPGAISWGAVPPAGRETTSSATNEPVRYQGAGLCQFALKDYVLAPQVESSINRVVQRLLDQHRATFAFQPNPGFRLRMRIFGRFNDYAQYTTNQGVRVPGLGRVGLTNLAGYYSRRTKELVTWRQQVSSNFGNVLLHEASHAIMDAHFRGTPQWLLEGCAEYFAYPPDMQDARDANNLKTRWGLLNLWLRDGKLASLPSFLNLRAEDWDRLDIDHAYITSWSIFQFLVSSDRNRVITRKLLTDRQGPRGPQQDRGNLLESEYPGGLKKLEADWHQWIVQTGRRLFPEKSLDKLREIDAERERRRYGP